MAVVIAGVGKYRPARKRSSVLFCWRMQKRALRVTVLTLLLACGLTAAYFLWNIEKQSSQLAATERDVTARLVRLHDAVTGIGVAQRSYVAPGQADQPWFDRTAALIQQLYDDLEGVRPRLRSFESAATLEALAASTGGLIAADSRTRQNLRLGQELMAVDVIFSDGRNILDAISARLAELREAEQQSYAAARATLSRQRWTVLGVTTLFWTLGLLAFAAPPKTVSSDAREQLDRPRDTVPTPQPSIPAMPAGRDGRIDLAAVADLCRDLSRVTATDALPGLLGRAAAILDASGVVLWMSAGDQLFAVIGHGYQREALTRLGPIAREADNAAAAAWRTGRMTIVRTDGTANGAVVAPMFAPEACTGVLAVEVRHGGEQDPATQAVAAMIASQLATVVPAWPAGSRELPSSAATDSVREARSA